MKLERDQSGQRGAQVNSTKLGVRCTSTVYLCLRQQQQQICHPLQVQTYIIALCFFDHSATVSQTRETPTPSVMWLNHLQCDSFCSPPSPHTAVDLLTWADASGLDWTSSAGQTDCRAAYASLPGDSPSTHHTSVHTQLSSLTSTPRNNNHVIHISTAVINRPLSSFSAASPWS